MKHPAIFAFFAVTVLTFSGCKNKSENEETPPPAASSAGLTASTPVLGYNILSHLPGIWNGPVSSSTPLGSYPEWIVDFRPVSAAQVSAKNELDSLNNILMGFFVARLNCGYRMAFRNGGGFAGQQRIAYSECDSVSETVNNYFYRFIDYKAGKNRVYTDILFKDDSLIMHVYTNQYNSLPGPVTHMLWKAKLQDTTATQPAITAFSFPQKILVRDFTGTFDARTEAIYYSAADLPNDPYNEASQPYLGQTTVNVSFAGSYTPDPTKKVFLMITTQPLFSGFTYLPANLKYRSRYVFLSSNDNAFTFNYMHPGTYYLYSLYDANGDGSFSSGDWMASNLTNTFTLTPEGTQNVNTLIDFTIP